MVGVDPNYERIEDGWRLDHTIDRPRVMNSEDFLLASPCRVGKLARSEWKIGQNIP